MAKKKKMVVAKKKPVKKPMGMRAPMMDKELLIAGATQPGMPPAAPGAMIPRPRRSASPCKGPRTQSPM